MSITRFIYSCATAIKRSQRITYAVLALALLLAALPIATPAHAEQIEQVQLAGGAGADVGSSIAVDAAGNRYLTGAFQSRATFGTGSNAVALTSRGTDDGFVAKYDATDSLVWVRQIGGSLTDQGRGIAIANDGSVYVTGQFSTQSAVFSSGVRLSSRGAGDIFIARYNRDGQLIWALRAGGTSGDNGLGLAVDSNGNALVTGNFAGQATFAAVDAPAAATLQSAGKIDSFVAKYDPQGHLVWARRAGGSGNDSGRGVAVVSDGDLYVAGSFSAVATFPSPAKSVELSSAGLDDIFVARYSASGDLRWAQRAGGARADRALAIALDANQNSYIAGFFTEAATIAGRALAGSGAEILLAKLDPNGTFTQAASAGGAGADEARGVALAPDRTIYLTGTYCDNAFFGEGAGLRELRQRDRGSLTNNGLFVAAYSPNFQPTFVEGAGFETDNREQSGNAVAVDAAGRAHVTGVVQRKAIFGVGSDTTTFATAGIGDAFFAVYARGTPREVFYLSSSSGGTAVYMPTLPTL